MLAVFVMAILYGIWRVFHIYWNKPKKREFERGEIRDATGQVVYSRRGYEIKLPDRRLNLPFSGLGALSPGIEYRFYYLPKSKATLQSDTQSLPCPDRRADLSSLLHPLPEDTGQHRRAGAGLHPHIQQRRSNRTPYRHESPLKESKLSGNSWDKALK